MRRREFLSVLGGAAAGQPLFAFAQASTPVVGFLSGAVPNPAIDKAFSEGLANAGYLENRDIIIERKWAYNQQSDLPRLVRELIERGVAVIVTSGGAPTALAAKVATTTIPIVALTGDDPVRLGLVTSMSRPNGNVTGVSFLSTQLESKRLGLLRELLPQASVVGLLLNLNFPDAEVAMRDAPVAARSFGLQTAIQAAGNENQIDAAFLSFSQQRVHAVLIGSDPYFSTRLDQLVSLADRYALPTMFWRSGFARAGGLISYGTDIYDAYRQMGTYAARILKGDKPADLPFVQSTKFELVINLKSAKRLGITVPNTLLVAADEVIE